MRMRFWLAILAAGLATPGLADENGIVDIGEAIASYRITAQYCHWPIPPDIEAVLNADERHFVAKNRQAFERGAQNGRERFEIGKAAADYCEEIKDARNSMTEDLKSRAK
jgi:hypothetical protein